MNELAIRLLLPVAAGYLTYALIARRALPWAKPTEAANRPRWILGCWLGLAIAVTCALVIHMQLSTQFSAAPVLAVFATLTTIGVVAWFFAKRKVRRLTMSAEKETLDQEDFDRYEMISTDEMINTDQNDAISAQTETTLDQDEYDLAFDQAYAAGENTMTSEAAMHTDDFSAEADQTLEIRELPETTLDQAQYDIAFEQAYASCKNAMVVDFSTQAHNLARHHHNLRNEAEKNLRITRRALANSESQVVQQRSERSDALIELESQLQDQIRLTAKAEHKILAETDKRCIAEHKLASTKEMMLQAKTEVRKNTDARARAVLTARKAVNFARRSIDARELSEKKLENLKSQLELQNNNVSNLIRSLEKEKQRNKQLHQQMEVKSELNLNEDGFRVLQTPEKSKSKSQKFTSAGELLRKVSRQT